LSFSISFLIRSQPADFGWELHEFDPFFNYRATQYIVENGIPAYYDWPDKLSWYPDGRDVSRTSQEILHISAAITYWIFGSSTNLYDFTILFPAIFGSLTSIVLFAIVRVIGGTTAGLFSALFFSISIPILVRGSIGWFKSEPLGLFFSLIGLYLLLSGINSNHKNAIVRLVGAGLFTIFGLSAWGGNQFFLIPIGLLFITLPFLRKDHKFLLWCIPLFTISTLIFSFGFEKLSFNLAFIKGLGGLSLIIPTFFVIICIFIQSKNNKNKLRNCFVFLIFIITISSSLLIINVDSNFLPLPSHRYLNAINPFLTTSDPLVDSVSEHATTTLAQSFIFHSVLMIFSGIGIWLIIKKLQNSSFIKNDMLVFSLILGLLGVYISSSFVRLEVFASISIIILASLGLTILIKEFFKIDSKSKKPIHKLFQISFITGIIILLVIPMVYPIGSESWSVTNSPPTILNGGTAFPIATNDWIDALDWMKNNTPKDAVIASWWDYGYWIQTMGERASLADNSTLDTKAIQNIAKMLLSNPDTAWQTLNEIQADYVLIFLAGEKLNLNVDNSLYTLRNGGDESKKQWFMKIAGYDTKQYLHSDGISGTDYFWNETLLGKTIPFSLLGYVNPNDLNEQSKIYIPGMLAIYQKDIKYPSNGDGPLKLVYASSSFTEEKAGPMLGVFIYEINKDYKPIP
jgi:dolichyl-diphosphooligosaccharide--protein glycosyltransferase